MGVDQQPEDRPYDETLEAARMFEDIARSEAELQEGREKRKPAGNGLTKSAKPKGDSASPADRLPPPGPPEAPTTVSQQSDQDHPPTGEKKEITEPSIGELFSKLVKMSPQDKIRIEKDSVGSLFKKYITKRG